MPLENQKDELYQTIINWQGDNDQVDDILILGFRI
jgi:serine phosphatase RsbU (regulator of sigma subunit)